MTHTVPLEVKADNPQQLKDVVGSIQLILSKVEPVHLIKLAEKIKKNPGIVKTALKFI
jgi:hypothetical protein